MPSHKLYIAPPGRSITHEKVFSAIFDVYPGNDFSSLLFIGPDASYLAHFKRVFHTHLLKSGRGKAYIPFQALTVKQIAWELYELHGSSEIISDEIRTLMLFQLLSDKNIGYARLLSGLLNKIRHYILNKDLHAIRKEVTDLIFEDKARDRALEALDVLGF